MCMGKRRYPPKINANLKLLKLLEYITIGKKLEACELPLLVFFKCANFYQITIFFTIFVYDIFYNNFAFDIFEFLTVKWFRKVHVHHAFWINDVKFYCHYLIYKCNFTSSLFSTTRTLRNDTKINWILKEISPFKPFQRFSFSLPSLSKLDR